jgi:hypothetical protein
VADVHDPRTSIEGATKNLLLLEDHLADPGMRCAECILKHWLCAEAYLSEAASLERNARFSQCVELAHWLQNLRTQFESGEARDLNALAALIRQARKAALVLQRGGST